MKLVVVGDVHRALTREAVSRIEAEQADAVLFVGDLPDLWHRNGNLNELISELSAPILILPGNHDGTSPLGVLAEGLGWPNRPGQASRQRWRMLALRRELHTAAVVGYSAHDVADVTVLAARPHSMGGGLSFAPWLRAEFGVGSLSESSARLCALVDEAVKPIVFLAHNGPAGFGGEKGAPSSHAGRDFGDPDLRVAIEHAWSTGKQVRAVVFGHMHHHGEREVVWEHGVPFVNAADQRQPLRFTVLQWSETTIRSGKRRPSGPAAASIVDIKTA